MGTICLWDAEAALSLPFTFKKPKKSLLNQKAPVGYTTPLEVYLVSQQLDTKLLTASLVLVAISNAFASTGLRHLLPPRPRMQCTLLGPGRGFGTSWLEWLSVKSTPTTPVAKSLNQTSGVTANQVYTPVVCNEASGSECFKAGSFSL